MLTTDHVRARKKDGRLELVPLGKALRKRGQELASQYIRLAASSIGEPREHFEQACAGVPLGTRDRRLAAGLKKLVEDRCDFAMATDADPAALRRAIFERAAEVRRQLPPGRPFDRAEVLGEAAREQGFEPDLLESLLYADLRSAQKLLSFEEVDPDELLRRYQEGQAQAVLLRAVHVRVEVWSESASRYRWLFRRLKFLRLLHTITAREDGSYLIEVDGPHSLFSQSTRYGLRLALLLPALSQVDRFRLTAQVRWGKDRALLRFELAGEGSGEAPDAELPEEVGRVRERFETRKGPWRASVGKTVLSLPGVGVCIPDLAFEHQTTGTRVHLEVLGFWSRAAVWKRVELVRSGLAEPIIFAVPARLRVSEDVLPDDLPAALYVYRSVLIPKELEARLETVANRAGAPP